MYERPAFAPPERDRDMLDAAAAIASAQAHTRLAQDAWAMASHARAVAAVPGPEVVPLAGVRRDAYPRPLTPARVARMPAVRPGRSPAGDDCSLSTVAISPKADGAALLLLASPAACQRWHLHPRAHWVGAVSVGAAPETPMLAAQQAVQQLLQRRGLTVADLDVLELHDAFAAQALAFAAEVPWPLQALNRQGGGLARGHPIGASGAIALVQALAQLQPGQTGLAAIAGAGGLGSATLVRA